MQSLLAKDASRAKSKIDKLLRQTPPALTDPVFYAVGGSWRALAKVHMAATQYPVQVEHGYTVAAREMRAFSKKLWSMPE